MGDTCVPSLIAIGTAINQYITKHNLLPEAICCCLQTCNVLASLVMVGDACTLNKAMMSLQFSIYRSLLEQSTDFIFGISQE